MKNNYYKAYKEVIEILNYLPQESINKIPENMIKIFKTKMDKDYEFSIDVNKSFENQELLGETKAILANIARDYWVTDSEKLRIIEKENYERKRIEELKREKYNPENIFKKEENFNERKENLAIISTEIEKEKFYQKLIKFIKKFLPKSKI